MMQTRNNFLLKALNVRPAEQWLVKKLFLLQFFQGAGIAFFFTAAFALFLDRFVITVMPWVFIYSSLLMWATGFVYSRLEHKLNIVKLAMGVTVFMALSILFFRLGFEYVQGDWFFYAMLAWFNVLYMLNNLEFWGIAALLFDARQSKRLFAVISAGDIPAKFVGYSLALLTVHYIGTINLLWAGALCMLSSLPFLRSIQKSGILRLASQHKHSASTKDPPKLVKLVHDFSGHVLIRRLAALSVILTSCFIIINFAFYAGIKNTHKDDVQLASFIAFFFAIVRVLALLVKMVFTSRLINKLGITKSLMITPVVMIILMLIILTQQQLAGDTKLVLYLFGVTVALVDILRSSINSPVFLTIMQPLSIHERLRAHTIVKGIMDPFASLASGVILLFAIRYDQGVNIITLCYILLVAGLFWVIGIFRVNGQYLRTIIKTISNRYFNGESFTINDSTTLEWLKTRLPSASENEAINMLSMLSKSNNEMANELIMLALQHTSENVKALSIKMLNEKNIVLPEESYYSFLKPGVLTATKAEAIKALAKIKGTGSMVISFLHDEHPEIKQAALLSLLANEDNSLKKEAENQLGNAVKSTVTANRIMAAEVLGRLNGFTSHNWIVNLLDDENNEVRKAAIEASGKIADETILKKVITMIPGNEKYVLNALHEAGKNSLPLIYPMLHGKNISSHRVEKLIALCGRIGGEEAYRILIKLLNERPTLFKAIMKALCRSDFILQKDQKPFFEKWAKQLLTHCAGIVYMQSSIHNYPRKYPLLQSSFVLELDELRDALLNVFAIMYDRENISRVKAAYLTGKRETIINAMEIIDITVKKEMANSFNAIYEPGDVENRLDGLKKIFPIEFFETVEQVLGLVLAHEKYDYHMWTTACTLYLSKKEMHPLQAHLVEPYTRHDNILLRETAQYAFAPSTEKKPSNSKT
ncbi:MAG: MFS transporter [Ferruginibacter sp.]